MIEYISLIIGTIVYMNGCEGGVEQPMTGGEKPTTEVDVGNEEIIQKKEKELFIALAEISLGIANSINSLSVDQFKAIFWIENLSSDESKAIFDDTNLQNLLSLLYKKLEKYLLVYNNDRASAFAAYEEFNTVQESVHSIFAAAPSTFSYPSSTAKSALSATVYAAFAASAASTVYTAYDASATNADIFVFYASIEAIIVSEAKIVSEVDAAAIAEKIVKLKNKFKEFSNICNQLKNYFEKQ